MVLTANGEVHTNEEAQVFVHDLNRLLEQTLAILSPGKLCKDHEYSLVVPVLSVNSGTISSCSTLPQGVVGTRCTLRFWKESSIKFICGSVLERGDELGTRKLVQKSLSDKKDAKDPSADMPFW